MRKTKTATRKRWKIKLKKGDTVVVLSGKDRGREGKIKRVLTWENKVIVEGINVVKKHVKAQGKDRPGGVLEIEKPLWVCKVALKCPNCGKATRIGWLLDKEGRKYRICRKCKGLIDKKDVS